MELGQLSIYIIVINTLTFILFGIDKLKAVAKKWRISESYLLGFSLIGGAFGAILAMGIFHHKTRKPKFVIGVPLMLVVHVGILVFLRTKGIF